MGESSAVGFADTSLKPEIPLVGHNTHFMSRMLFDDRVIGNPCGVKLVFTLY